MIDISLWLSTLAGMVLLDTIIGAIYLKKLSESALELIVAVLIWIIAKLLSTESTIATYLGNAQIFRYVLIGTVVIVLGVMFYHVFEIVTRDDRQSKKSGAHANNHTTPAEKDKRDK